VLVAEAYHGGDVFDFLQQVPETMREAEAERLLAEFKEREEQINREEKISKILCNIISAATIDYEYLTDECVEIYLKRSLSSVQKLIADIDYEISLLKKLEGLFLKAGGSSPQ
jgi:replicative DNA helicase